MQKVIVFDFDGVLADSAQQAFEIYIEIAARLNARRIETVEKFKELSTGHWARSMAYMGIEPDENGKFSAAEAIFQELHPQFQGAVKLFANIPELLNALKDQGYGIAIVSSHYRSAITEKLKEYGLFDLVSVIIGYEDVENHKPHPESLLACAGKLDIDPGHAIYVGDSVGDIQAAREAGYGKMICVTYGWNSKEVLAEEKPDAFIDEPMQLLSLLE